MAKTQICETCGEEMVLDVIEARGDFETYSATLIDFPVLRCPEGHVAREAHDEFMVTLGERLGMEGHLFTKRAGLVKRRDVCRGCGAELSSRSVGPQSVEVQLEHGGAPAYRVRITAPVITCSECDVRQVPNRDEHHLGISSAIRNALDAAQIEYDG